MEPNELEQDNIPEEYLQEEAEQRLANKPSPKLQAYLDKYQDVDFNTAKRNGVHGVKMMLDDYQSGALKQKYPDLPDDEIVSSIEQQEAASQEPDDSFLAKAMDVPKQVVGGFRDAAQAVIDLGVDAANYAGDKLASQYNIKTTEADKLQKVKLPEVSQPKSMVGGLARGVSQFLAPFGVLNKAGKAAGLVGKATSTAGKFAEASAIGAATDFIAFGEHEKRLSDLIESNPILSNPVSRYLKSNPSDGVAEGRFKNALEGLGLGAATEGMFHAVKWIRDTKVVKDTAKQMQKEAESRMTLMDKSYDDLINEIKTIPLRNKKTTTLSELSKSAEGVNWTKEDLLSGKAINELDAKSTQPLVIKATQIQEEAFNKVKEAIPDYRARIDAGDMRAIDDYWGEMTELHKLDFVAKDIAAKHGGAEAMVYRRHNTAVEQSNAMYKIFAKADTLDKRKMVEAHMNILESKGDIDGFVNALTMGKGDKLKNVIRNISMAWRLSSPSTHWKNIVSTSLNGLIMSPLEHGVAAGIGSIRRTIGSTLENAGHKISNGFFSNLNDTHRYKQSQILFHSMVSSHVDAIKYIGNALRGQTETAIAAAKKGEKLSRMQDIVDASKRNRFDTGITRDDIAERTFDAMSLGIEKEGIIGTASYHLANFLGSVTRQPGKFINTYDDAFKGMFFKAKVESEAYRIAASEGIAGEELEKRWGDLFNIGVYKPNIEDGASSIPKWMKENKLYSNDDIIRNLQEDAVKYAKEMTYTGKMNKMAESMKNFRDAIDDVMPIIPGGTLIMPFIKTPANLIKYFAFDRGPLLLAQESFYADLRAGGRKGEMAIARLGVGTALMGFGVFLKMNGYLFGDGPKNTGEKYLHRELGIPERSIRIGDTFYDIGWLDPISSFLTYPANVIELADAMDDDMDEELSDSCKRYLAAGALGLANTLLSKSYMQGLSEFVTAISDQDKGALERFFKSQVASTLIPNAVTFVGKQINPKMQAPDTLWETIKDKAGIDINRPRLDAFGREVKRNPLVNSILIPITYQNYKDEKTIQELINAGAYIKQPKRTIDGVRLTPDQYNKMLSYMGEQDVYGQIERVVKSPVFQEASNSRQSIDEEGDKAFTKKAMVELIHRENLKMAKAKLVSETPELQNKILDFKLKSFNKPARTVGDTRLLQNLSVKVDSNK